MKSFKDSLIWQMLLSSKRQYVIGIKRTIMKKLVNLAMKYPEPTRENCINPNTRILLDIKDKFFECERNKGRDALFRAIWQIFIVEYEHDPYYRQRINWVLRELRDWDYSEQPQDHWNGK